MSRSVRGRRAADEILVVCQREPDASASNARSFMEEYWSINGAK